MTVERPRRVLIVDDDSEVRLLLATALRGQSLDIDEAVDGAQAIGMLRENAYAVVLLDLMMPDVDGFGVLDAIHTDRSRQPVVLVISGASRQMLDRAAAASQVHGVVRKPFDPIEVASIVASCVEVSGSHGGFETMAVATIVSAGALITLL